MEIGGRGERPRTKTPNNSVYGIFSNGAQAQFINRKFY